MTRPGARTKQFRSRSAPMPLLRGVAGRMAGEATPSPRNRKERRMDAKAQRIRAAKERGG